MIKIDTDTYYGIDERPTYNTVYRITLEWSTDEAGVRAGRPDVTVEPLAEFEKRDNALAFVRAWNHPDLTPYG